MTVGYVAFTDDRDMMAPTCFLVPTGGRGLIAPIELLAVAR